MKLAEKVFGNKLRVRVNGLCYKGEQILLVKHDIDGNMLWAPPGGGVEFGESIEDALIREFHEETSLRVIPGKFLFLMEFIEKPLHAIELFYEIKSYSGKLTKGSDPETGSSELIMGVGFYDQQNLDNIPQSQLHNCLRICNNLRQLLDKRGHLVYDTIDQ